MIASRRVTTPSRSVLSARLFTTSTTDGASRSSSNSNIGFLNRRLMERQPAQSDPRGRRAPLGRVNDGHMRNTSLNGGFATNSSHFVHGRQQQPDEDPNDGDDD